MSGEGKVEFYRRLWLRAKEENEKLMALLLLTDPSVSSVEMNDLSLRQHSELLKWRLARDQRVKDLAQSLLDEGGRAK